MNWGAHLPRFEKASALGRGVALLDLRGDIRTVLRQP
jgi:hypothetical protein